MGRNFELVGYSKANDRTITMERMTQIVNFMRRSRSILQASTCPKKGIVILFPAYFEDAYAFWLHSTQCNYSHSRPYGRLIEFEGCEARVGYENAVVIFYRDATYGNDPNHVHRIEIDEPQKVY